MEGALGGLLWRILFAVTDEADEQSYSAAISDREQLASDAVDECGNSILRLAYSYLHNMQDAEDILQETLIKFVTVAPSFISPAHRKAWLMKVASNLSKNRIDYNRLRISDELDENIPAAGTNEDLSFVWEAVRSLPVKQREVIHLFYQEGYSTSEISSITGRRESTVRSDLKRGRDRLRDMLKEADDFE